MSGESTFQIQSTLAASAAEVWRHSSSMAGVNHELSPLMRMTHPAGLERIDQQAVPLGERCFRSYLLAFGFLPVDWDDLAFESITPGSGFTESSSLATARVWRHRRWIEPLATGGCRLEDHLTWAPRIPGTGFIHRRIVPLLFRHRHRRLVALFGGVTEVVGCVGVYAPSSVRGIPSTIVHAEIGTPLRASAGYRQPPFTSRSVSS